MPRLLSWVFALTDPAEYGRLKLAADGSLDAIVEFKDASASERAIGLCNGGAMAIDARHLFSLLDTLRAANAQSEYYLSGIVVGGTACTACRGRGRNRGHEVLGINCRADLAAAEAEVQDASQGGRHGSRSDTA